MTALTPLPDPSPPTQPNSSSDSPRSRLLHLGAAALSDGELLSLVLRNRGGVAAAERLLASAGGLASLIAARPWPSSAGGITRNEAITLHAACELGRRLLRTNENRPRFFNPRGVYEYLLPRLQGLSREEFHVLCVNSRTALLFHARVAVGTVNACPVDPREVFSAALSVHSSAIILAHNHPSGDPEPSIQDLTLTHQLVSGARLLGLRVLDHVIIGDGRFVSLRERHQLDPSKPDDEPEKVTA